MRIIITLTTLLIGLGFTVMAQGGNQPETQSIANLMLVPINFNGANEPIEMDVNFKAENPANITSVELTLASNASNLNAVVKVIAYDQWFLWTRGDLKVLSYRIMVPSSLIGNCHFAKIKVTNTDGTTEVLESMPF